MQYIFKKCTVLKLVFIILIAIDCPAQITQKTTVDSTESWIRNIVAEYNNINNDTTKFRKEEMDVFGQSSEGGSLEKYYDGKTLRKAILILYGENGKLVSEYYFLDQELIFVHDKDITYKAPIYLDKTEIKSEEENKYYFKNKRLIRWTLNDGKIQEGILYPDKEEQLLNDLKLIF